MEEDPVVPAVEIIGTGRVGPTSLTGVQPLRHPLNHPCSTSRPHHTGIESTLGPYLQGTPVSSQVRALRPISHTLPGFAPHMG